MDYDKQPINVDEQVALLQNRGLVIEDIATAKLQLRNISYFRIASYLRYMEEDRQFHHYKLGSTFEQADGRNTTPRVLGMFCRWLSLFYLVTTWLSSLHRFGSWRWLPSLRCVR